MSAIWGAVGSSELVKPMIARSCRLVETQEEAATLSLVDTFAEQDALEALLEKAKPPVPTSANGLHYLLSTPFRYPPLPHGSRFGRRSESGILYASITAETCLAEVAYYRFVFLHDIEAPPPNPVITQHTLFWFKAHHNRGVDLTDPVFHSFSDTLTHCSSYIGTQELGSELRRQEVSLIRYSSARCPEAGHNVAVLSPQAIKSRAPEDIVAISCMTRESRVFFQGDIRAEFSLSDFLDGGKLPLPA